MAAPRRDVAHSCGFTPSVEIAVDASRAAETGLFAAPIWGAECSWVLKTVELLFVMLPTANLGGDWPDVHKLHRIGAEPILWI